MQNKYKRLLLKGMKHSIYGLIFQIFLMASLMANETNAQSVKNYKIYVTLNNSTISETFDLIEKSSDFRFIFKTEDIDQKVRLNLPTGQYTIAEILELVSKEADLKFKQINANISASRMVRADRRDTDFERVEDYKDRTITGKVTAKEDGQGLPTATVQLKGTTNGVLTDPDGNYSITVPDSGGTLLFSFLGYVTQEVEIGNQTVINIVLAEDATSLGEFVVTAQGIAREKKALGFALSEVKSELIETRPENSVANILRGKVPGVQITSRGGLLGSATDVVIRGVSSINGDNQPLYIVDGVFYEGNRFVDLDPNNIEDIKILKGLAASSLYGQEGRNGVVLVTTKTAGRNTGEDLSITLTQQVFINQVTGLPEFQNTYGQGSQNTPNTGFVGNWGGRFDDNYIVDNHFNQSRFASIFPDLQGTVPYQAFPNNIDDFFQNGRGTNTSLVANARMGESTIGFSVGYNDEEGYLSSNNLRKLNLSLSANTKIAEKLNLSTTFQFNNTVIRRPPNDIFSRTLFLPRNYDLLGLPWENPFTGASTWYRTDRDNPIWQNNNHQNGTDNNRVFMKVALNYDITDFMSISYRLGYDQYVTESFARENKGGVRFSQGLGFYNQSSFTRSNFDHNILINTKEISINSDLSITSQLGFNARSINTKTFGINSTEQLVFGFFQHENFLNYQPAGDSKTRTNVLGLYAQTQFTYKDYLYLTLSARNDWGSQLEVENNSLLYPSASLSFVPTEVWESAMPDFVDFLKLRFGYGSSAGFPSPFRTRPILDLTPISLIVDGANITTNSISGVQPNPNLKPERQREFELGAEATIFNGAVDLDISWYKRINEDQVFSAQLPPSTGFTSTSINAGRIDTKGLEMGITVFPVRNSNMTYSITNNFTAYETTVIDLPEPFVEYSGNNAAVIGFPLGVFRTTYIVRDDEGNALINPNDGTLLTSGDVGLDQRVTGDPNPDFQISQIHGLTYKNFNLTVQLEYTHGGDILSTYVRSIYERGVSTDTEDREGTFFLPGVLGDVNTGLPLLDESGNKIPNRIQMTLNDIVFGNSFNSFENNIFDASVFRIREINLNYSLPTDWARKIGLQGVTLTGNVQNVFWYAPHFPKGIRLDPENNTSGENGFGEQGIADPSIRKFALGLRIQF